MKVRLIGAVALVGLLASACAGLPAAADHSPSPTSAPGITVTIGPDDNGQTIQVPFRGRLVFDVSPKEKGRNLVGWRITQYPKDLLTLESEHGVPPYTFQASNPGIGKLEIIFGPICGSPGPAAAPESIPCPVVGPGGIPVRLLTFTIRVFAGY